MKKWIFQKNFIYGDFFYCFNTRKYSWERHNACGNTVHLNEIAIIKRTILPTGDSALKCYVVEDGLISCCIGHVLEDNIGKEASLFFHNKLLQVVSVDEFIKHSQCIKHDGVIKGIIVGIGKRTELLQ